MSGRGAGRRAGSPDTRSEILDAARSRFAELGYDRATIRGIASDAGVDPALVHHYFGTKEQLFAESIDIPADAVAAALATFGDDPGRVGERLAGTFFAIWEDEAARSSLLGIIRSAAGGEDQAVAAFREFITHEMLDRIAPMIDGDDARLRALMMASHLVGVAMARYVLRVEPLASASVDEIVEVVAPRLQSYVR